jgi:DNA-binding transcriptional ArsR family regulator
MRAVLTAVLALSSQARGFRVEDLASFVAEILDTSYTPRQASYDLRKLRGKGLVKKIERTRRYECPVEGLRTVMAVVLLREKVIKPILAAARTPGEAPRVENKDPLNAHYHAVRDAMEKLFQQLGLAT